MSAAIRISETPMEARQRAFPALWCKRTCADDRSCACNSRIGSRFFVSVFVLGAGAFLSTYPTEIIRETGIVLMAGALIGLAMWFSRGSVRRKMISLLPWALIIGGPIVGVVWLYLAKEQKLPGFASYAVIRLYDTPDPARLCWCRGIFLCSGRHAAIVQDNQAREMHTEILLPAIVGVV